MPRKAKCRHTHADYIQIRNGEKIEIWGCYSAGWHNENFGYGDSRIVFSAICRDCGVQLSLGPSNDEPAGVRVEMLAADLYTHGFDHTPPFGRSMTALFGFANHMKQIDSASAWEPEDKICADWWAGWLIGEISSHDNRETRDADAWSWSIDRPIAEQEAEWIASRERHLARLKALRVPAPHSEPEPSTSDHPPACDEHIGELCSCKEDAEMIAAAQAVDPNDPTLRPWDAALTTPPGKNWSRGVFFPHNISPESCAICGCSRDRHEWVLASGDLACPIVVTNPNAINRRIGDIITDDEGSRFRVYGFNPQDGLPMAHCIDAEDNCATCHTGAGCEEHRTFQCSDCNKLTPWSRGGDEDDRCDDCWSKAFSDKLASSHGSDTCTAT